jgi:hypothetical protein
MSVPTYSSVCRELHAARGHLYAMLETLSPEELLWLPPRPDGISISYHFGHIALVEDMHVAEATGKPLLTAEEFRDAFGVRNVNNRAAQFPPAAAIIDYMQAVRTQTLELAALRFRAIRDAPAAHDAAELFRRIINHEYSHTKYIRRIRAEMGKAPVDPPASDLVQADAHAIAPPQYALLHW